MNKHERRREFLRLLDAGHQFVVLYPGTKRPMQTGWQDVELSESDIKHWSDEGCNFGLKTGDLIVADKDTRAQGRVFFCAYQDILRYVVLTPRGIHFGFKRNGEEVRNHQSPNGDIRGSGGYCLAPGSTVNGHTYRFVEGFDVRQIDHLCPFQSEWLPRKQSKYCSRAVEHPEKYIRHILAVSGEQGHNATFRAACILIDSGLSEFDAFHVLWDWNANNARPPWSVNELLHKVRDAATRRQ